MRYYYYLVGKVHPVVFTGPAVGCRWVIPTVFVRSTHWESTFQFVIYAKRPGISPGRKLPERKCKILLDDQVSQAYFLLLNQSSSGDEGIRTPGLRLAKAALSQLSYIPGIIMIGVVGLTGFEPVTPALSAQCSNQLSYRPFQRALATEE